MEFEPKIVAFCCNWCSYAGADGAGVGRIQYPHNVRIIKSMCSARVDPVFVLESFIKGADGVLVLACHLADCHYDKGNYATKKRFEMLIKAIKNAGIDPRRLKLDWISATEGEKFAQLIRETVREIKELGPLKGRKEVKKIGSRA
ncbi:MAG: hydrogenase iron-sulfur subunit [Candidatus Hydrothermarchaeota archaeon]|nr:hydrogenase iron-sulfur subunit [Candidatus Hydrothermarchaeota archaeon]